MDPQLESLTEHVWTQYTALTPSARLLVAIAGSPGSGKTTLAAKLVDAVNKRQQRASPGASQGTSQPAAALLPMDGFHLPRSALAGMPDAAAAFARRGAPFTFDAAAYVALVRRLREPLTPESRTIRAPSFDHAVKDPVADDIPIAPSARVVVVEGNYVALDQDVWRDAAAMMDLVVFVDVPEDTARRRLVRRHLAAGIAKTEAEAVQRANENDLPNGREIADKRFGVGWEVKSVEDEAW